MHLKISYPKWWPFYPGWDELTNGNLCACGHANTYWCKAINGHNDDYKMQHEVFKDLWYNLQIQIFWWFHSWNNYLFSLSNPALTTSGSCKINTSILSMLWTHKRLTLTDELRVSVKCILRKLLVLWWYSTVSSNLKILSQTMFISLICLLAQGWYPMKAAVAMESVSYVYKLPHYRQSNIETNKVLQNTGLILVLHPANERHLYKVMPSLIGWAQTQTGLILGLCPANERRHYKVTPSLIGWAQT